MEIIDFKKTYKAYYSPKPGRPEIVTVPKMQFAMIDGQGDPANSRGFQDAVAALYSIAFGLKFARKKAGAVRNFTLAPLEGLWWTEAGEKYAVGSRAHWQWTLMIWLPDFITTKEFKQAAAELKTKKGNPALGFVRLDTFREGTAVQALHTGPYATEPATVKLMTEYAAAQGYVQNGKHHEIYLSDPRRVAPEKLRTILRHPVAKA